MNYLTDNLALSSLTKAALVEILAVEMGISGRESREMVNGFFELILEQLSLGKQVKLSGFGNFEVKKRGARPGRNPRTGEDALISSRQVVKFSSSPKLVQRMAARKWAESASEARRSGPYALQEIAYARPLQEPGGVRQAIAATPETHNG